MNYSKKLVLPALLCTLSLTALPANCLDYSDIDAVLDHPDPSSVQQLIETLRDCEHPALLAYGLHYAASRFYHQRDMALALKMLQEAFEIRSKDPETPRKELGKTAYNLGHFYLQENRLTEATTFLQKGEDLFLQDSFYYGAILCQKNLASLYEIKGDYANALEQLEVAISTARSYGFAEKEADLLVDQGIIYVFLKNYDPGLANLQAAKVRYLELQRDESLRHPGNLAACLLNFAFAYDDLRQPQKAIHFYQEALRMYRQLEDHYHQILCQSNMGFTLLQDGQLEKATALLEAARSAAILHDFPVLEAMCLDNLGDVALAREQCFEALDLYEQAIEVLTPNLSALEQTGADALLRAAAKKDHLLNYLQNQGAALKACYVQTGERTYLLRALETYQQADQLVDWMRYEHTARASKLFWREATRDLYESAIWVAHELQDPERGFFFMEKSKAILLLDAMQADQARRLIPESLEQEERKLQRQLTEARLAYLQAAPMERSQWQDSTLALQQALDALVERISAEHRAYAQMRYGSQIVDATAFQQAFLGAGDATGLAYFIGTRAAYAWIGTGNGPAKLMAMDLQELDSLMQAYLTMLSEADKAFYPDAYAELSHALLHTLLRGLPNYREQLPTELLILPDGKLGLIPFEALQLRPEFSVEHYLIQQTVVRYAYSASVLAQQGQHPQEAGPIFTLAPLFESQQRGLPTLTMSHTLLDGFRLRDYHKQTGTEVTVSYFDSVIEHAYVLNLITHASAQGEELPRIEFADRSLYLPELYARHVPANLVVLGACQTGTGALQKGEGLLSLSSGFAHAGVSSLIASLWNVREATGTEILTTFYQNLQEGQSKATALANAKKAYLRSAKTSASNPYYWAAFVYMGADGPLALPGKIPILAWLGAGLSILVGMWFVGSALKGRSRASARQEMPTLARSREVV